MYFKNHLKHSDRIWTQEFRQTYYENNYQHKLPYNKWLIVIAYIIKRYHFLAAYSSVFTIHILGILSLACKYKTIWTKYLSSLNLTSQLIVIILELGMLWNVKPLLWNIYLLELGFILSKIIYKNLLLSEYKHFIKILIPL